MPFLFQSQFLTCMITAVAQAAMCLPLARLRRRAMPTLCQGGSMKMLNELVLMLMLMLTLGLCGVHVGDGKGSFNCDGEDGGGDNEDWEG